MLYDVYEKRILKIARVFKFIRRHARIILIALGIITISTITLLATKGIAGKTTCPETIPYGDTLICEASAFMSDVYFEFRGTDGTWSAQVPRYPGHYYVRSVGTGITGNPRYGEETPFTITPREVNVQVTDNAVIYGELPRVGATLPYGDTLSCDSVFFEDLLQTSTNVTPDASRVHIYAQDGRDVTSAYVIQTVSQTISIQQRPLTVTVEGSSQVYNGQKLTFDKYEISGGTLAENDSLYAVFDKWIVDVGEIENDPVLRVINGKGQEVTHHYNITRIVGKLTVEAHPLVITTGSAQLTYNGDEQSLPSFTVSEDTPLVPNQYIEILASATHTNANVYENILTFRILNENEDDCTHNYAIIVNYGTLEILKRQASAITHDGNWVYDGEEHSMPSADVIGLVKGHTYAVSEMTGITDFGTTANLLKLLIMDGENDVSANYELAYTRYGTLSVTKRNVTLRTTDATAVYDGKPHYSHCFEALLDQGFDLVPTHKLIVDAGTSITDVGSIQNMVTAYHVEDAAGNDKTVNYTINIINNGILTVTERPIVLRATDVTYVYDGLPHGGGMPIIDESSPYPLVTGHEAFADVIGEQTDVGTAHAELRSPKIMDGTRDVTHNYSIKTVKGLITVTPRPIRIIITDAEKVYDGTPLTSNAFTVSPVSPLTFALVEGHTVVDVVTDGSQTNVGESANKLVSLRILDGARDVTGNYECIPQDGTLTVTPRPITVSSGSAEKIFDGTPLTCDTPIFVSKGNLVLDHVLDMKATGSITEVGSTPNTIEGTVRDGNDEDVGGNYEITYDQGTLTVKPRAKILVTTGSARAPYTGNPLTCDQIGYTMVEGQLLPGHTIELKTTGSQTEIGMSYNTFDISLTDKWGQDVSHFYNIEKALGLLEVYDPEDDSDDDDEGDDDGDDGDDGGNGGGGGGSGGSGGTLDDSGKLNGGHSGGNKGEDSVVLLIKSDNSGKVYFRLESFGDFTGQGFDKATEYHLLLDNIYSYNYLTSIALQNAGIPTSTMQIQSFTSQYLLPYYLGLGHHDYDLQTSDVRYAGTGLTEYSLQYHIYNGTGTDLQGLLDAYSDAELAYREFVYKQYLTIDETTRAAMDKIIAEENFSIKDPYIIKRIATYIQHVATYNLNYNKAVDEAENAVLAFLEYKEGVCRHYAATATVLFRALGIPARYTIGYVGQTLAGEWAKVTGASGHAWVEVYVDGVGWIPVEVTGSSSGGGGGGDDTNDEIIEIAPAYQCKPYDGTPLYAVNQLMGNSLFLELLQKNYTCTVTVTGEQTEIGIGESLIVDFKLFDPAGKDVTNDYTIKYHPGVLEILAPEVEEIEINPIYQCKPYDGTPLYAVNKIEGNPLFLELLQKNYTYTVEITGEQTEIGIGESLIVDFKLFDPTGKDVTDDYAVKYLPGVLEVLEPEMKQIKIYLYQLQKYYDGSPLQFENEDFEILEIEDGLELALNLKIKLTDAGYLSLSDLNANVGDYVEYRVLSKGTDVTKFYRITFCVPEAISSDTYIPIRIDPRLLELTADSAEKLYDKTALQSPGATVTMGSLLPGHKIAEIAIMGEITTVGEAPCNIIEKSIKIIDRLTGNDVTENYNITTKPGVLTVLSPDP